MYRTDTYETCTAKSVRWRCVSCTGEQPPAVLRAKGVLYLKEDPTHRRIFQLVGKRWSLEPDGAWGEGPHILSIGDEK